MTSIKPLPNLKANALAVTVPEDFHHAEIEFGELGVFITDSSFPELPRAWSWTKLPPGEWKLLGRASELYPEVERESTMHLSPLQFLQSAMPYGWWRDYNETGPDAFTCKTMHESWKTYKGKMGLTNEVILIDTAIA